MSICWLVGAREKQELSSPDRGEDPEKPVFAIKLTDRELKGLYRAAYQLVSRAQKLFGRKGAAGMLYIGQVAEEVTRVLKPGKHRLPSSKSAWDWLLPNHERRPENLWPVRQVQATPTSGPGTRAALQLARQNRQGVAVQPALLADLKTVRIPRGRLSLGLGGIWWAGSWTEGWTRTRRQVSTTRIRHSRIIEAGLRRGDQDEVVALLRRVVEVHPEHFLLLLQRGLEPELGPDEGSYQPLAPQARQVVVEALSSQDAQFRQDVIRAAGGTGLADLATSNKT